MNRRTIFSSTASINRLTPMLIFATVIIICVLFTTRSSILKAEQQEQAKDIPESLALETQSQFRTDEPQHVQLQGRYVNAQLSSDDEPVEFVYQVPATANDARIDGVLFVAHGCSHSATDWWPRSDSCPLCIGLPIEVSIVKAALRRRLLVVAISSADRGRKCWRQTDAPRVHDVIAHIYKTIVLPVLPRPAPAAAAGAARPPLFMLGASSGGAAVGAFAMLGSGQPMRFPYLHTAALCVQISAVHPVPGAVLPPAMFMLMERDSRTMEAVQALLPQLGSADHQVRRCAPRPIAADFFLRHGAVSSAAESALLQEALLRGGFIDSTTLMLVDDPRHTDWRSAVQQAMSAASAQHPALAAQSLVADESPISELINVAWAQHEITDESIEEVLDFFVAHV